MEFSKAPDVKECARTRHPTIHRRTDLVTVFSALLPQRKVEHPLGCLRLPNRTDCQKLVEVFHVRLLAYERMADSSSSATTLRRRRDEWIAFQMIALGEMALEAYYRIIGLHLADTAMDGYITKTFCGGKRLDKSPLGRRKEVGARLSDEAACFLPTLDLASILKDVTPAAI